LRLGAITAAAPGRGALRSLGRLWALDFGAGDFGSRLRSRAVGAAIPASAFAAIAPLTPGALLTGLGHGGGGNGKSRGGNGHCAERGGGKQLLRLQCMFLCHFPVSKPDFPPGDDGSSWVCF
jgi:hypothetical protein